MKVGIDFGTSTSEIAFVDEKGNVTVIPNHLGEIITPSAVYYDEVGKAIVGREAKEKALVDPENTFLEVKRLFGQGTILRARKHIFKPVDVAADIFRYLIDCAEKYTEQEIDSAVITVPAYFTDNQRKEVMSAGQAAGLKVDRIINEPTAASLDYGIKHLEDCEYILVYDLGGGTLDVTVLELFEGVIEVKASSGNNALGGKDFDQAIVDHITETIKKKDKVDISENLRAAMRVKIAAESCKIALSTELDYDIDLPFLYSIKDNPAGYSDSISQEFFERLINNMVESTATQVESALRDARLEPTDINLVLLVGGSSHIPLIQRFLKKSFGFEPQLAENAELAVVRGAAIQAGVLSGVLDDTTIALTDVCPYSLSTDVLIPGFFGGEIVCDILIPRNTTLPSEVSKMYATSRDNQEIVIVHAYQGESKVPEENYLLGAFSLGDIPKGRAGKEAINIRFAYDLNGILEVSAEVVSTGKSTTITIDTATMGDELDLDEWKKSPLAKKYRQLINKAMRLVKVHGDEAEDIELCANELKKALVLNWDAEVLAKQELLLKEEIRDFEYYLEFDI